MMVVTMDPMIMKTKNTDILVLEGVFIEFYYKTLPGRIYDEEMFENIRQSEKIRIIRQNRNKKLNLLIDDSVQEN